MGTLVHLRLDRFISHLPQVLNHRCTIDLIGVFNDNTTFIRFNPNSKHPAQLPQPFMNRVVATASHYILYLYITVFISLLPVNFHAIYSIP